MRGPLLFWMPLVSIAASLLLFSPREGAAQVEAADQHALSIFWEEDNLQAHPHTDRNYTMGLGFSYGTVSQSRLDAPLRVMNLATAAIARTLLSVAASPLTLGPPRHYSRRLIGTAGD